MRDSILKVLTSLAGMFANDKPRFRKPSRYYPAGLNGKRAVARRQRQIAAGTLKVSP